MHFITIFIVRNPVIFLISFAVHPLSAIIFLCKGTVPELGSSTASLLLQNWNGILPANQRFGYSITIWVEFLAYSFFSLRQKCT